MTVSEVGRIAMGFSISVLPQRVTQATSGGFSGGRRGGDVFRGGPYWLGNRHGILGHSKQVLPDPTPYQDPSPPTKDTFTSIQTMRPHMRPHPPGAKPST